MKRLVSIVLCTCTTVIGVTGCAVRPDGSSGLNRDLVLTGVSNEQAYHRANDFMHTCHPGLRGFTTTDISGELYPESKTSVVRATFKGGLVPETISIRQIGDDAHVSIVTIERPLKWDAKELDAAQQSLETGKPVCR